VAEGVEGVDVVEEVLKFVEEDVEVVDGGMKVVDEDVNCCTLMIPKEIRFEYRCYLGI